MAIPPKKLLKIPVNFPIPLKQIAYLFQVLPSDNIVLKNEARIYTILSDIKGVPNMRNFGMDGSYNFMVLDILGPSLLDLKNDYGVIPKIINNKINNTLTIIYIMYTKTLSEWLQRLRKNKDKIIKRFVTSSAKNYYR